MTVFLTMVSTAPNSLVWHKDCNMLLLVLTWRDVHYTAGIKKRQVNKLQTQYNLTFVRKKNSMENIPNDYSWGWEYEKHPFSFLPISVFITFDNQKTQKINSFIFWGIVGLQYISFKYTTQWFKIFIIILPLKLL